MNIPQILSHVYTWKQNHSVKLRLVVPSTMPWRNKNLNIDVSLADLPKDSFPHLVYHRHLTELFQQYHDCDLYFTDGAKTTKSTICAVIKNDTILEKNRILTSTQVLTAELFTSQTAVKAIAKSQKRENCILTGFLSALFYSTPESKTSAPTDTRDIKSNFGSAI